MNDADAAVYRDLARRDPAAAEQQAALCGARANSDRAPISAEIVAGGEVAAEDNDQLSPRQSRAAAMLAAGMSVREIAAVLDLHRGTIFRWRQSSPAFRREQRRVAAEAAGEFVGIARRLIVKATGYVDRVMEEDSDRSDWAARILRNRNLWDLARSGSEAAGD